MSLFMPPPDAARAYPLSAGLSLSRPGREGSDRHEDDPKSAALASGERDGAPKTPSSRTLSGGAAALSDVWQSLTNGPKAVEVATGGSARTRKICKARSTVRGRRGLIKRRETF